MLHSQDFVSAQKLLSSIFDATGGSLKRSCSFKMPRGLPLGLIATWRSNWRNQKLWGMAVNGAGEIKCRFQKC